DDEHLALGAELLNLPGILVQDRPGIIVAGSSEILRHIPLRLGEHPPVKETQRRVGERIAPGVEEDAGNSGRGHPGIAIRRVVIGRPIGLGRGGKAPAGRATHPRGQEPQGQEGHAKLVNFCPHRRMVRTPCPTVLRKTNWIPRRRGGGICRRPGGASSSAFRRALPKRGAKPWGTSSSGIRSRSTTISG